MNRVYLAGPISGLTHTGATTWRDAATDILAPAGIECFSPMRHTDDLKASGEILAEKEYTGTGNAMGTSRGIMTRDFFDVQRADLLVVNFLGAERISIGTIMEVAWAWHMQKPVIVAAEAGNRHIEHLMMKEAISIVVPTIEEACQVALAYLRPHRTAADALRGQR